MAAIEHKFIIVFELQTRASTLGRVAGLVAILVLAAVAEQIVIVELK